MKIAGGKLVLVAGVTCAVASCLMVYRFMQQAELRSQPVANVQVVTAGRSIEPRSVITSDMLKLVSLPVTVKLPEALTSVQQAEGKVARMPILPGEQLLSAKLFSTDSQSGLAFTIPQGKRAIAVAVNEVVGTGGLILPGDHVDVVAVLEPRPNGTAPPGPKPTTDPADNVVALSQYVLQDVEVLAVAQNYQQATSGTDQTASTISKQPLTANAPTDIPKSVTLAVDATDVQKIVLAEDRGHIRLALRSHGDTSTVDVQGGLFSSLQGAATLKAQVNP